MGLLNKFLKCFCPETLRSRREQCHEDDSSSNSSCSYTTSTNEETFDLLQLPYAPLRIFINALPINDLHAFRQTCQYANKVTKFRGKYMKQLTIFSRYVTESPAGGIACRIQNDDFYKSVTPFFPRSRLVLILDGNVDIKAVARVVRKSYKELHIFGDYTLQEIWPLFHDNLSVVLLSGECTLPDENVEEFFNLFKKRSNLRIRILCTNLKQTWINAARNAVFGADSEFEETIGEVEPYEYTKLKSTCFQRNNVLFFKYISKDDW